MSRTRVIVTRPEAWAALKSEPLDVLHVDIGRRLRNGQSAGDEMGSVATKSGAARLVRAFKKHRPDVFLFWVHFGTFGHELLEKLRGIAPDCVFVHGSGNHVLNEHKVCWYIHKYHREIDAVLTSTTDEKRKRLFAKWVKYVGTLYTYGFDPGLFKAPSAPPSYDCFFGGGDSVSESKPNGRFKFSKFRHDLVTEVGRRHSLLLRGGGTWPEELGCKPGLRYVDYFREMQKAKIVLGTYHDNLERRYSKRTVYGGASGRLFMTRYIPGMELDFNRGEKNMVWFETVAEGLDLIRYYLDNSEEREAIAVKQRAHFVKHHSWEARLRDFERLVPELLEVRR